MRPSQIESLFNSKSEHDREICIPLLRAHLAANPQDAKSWYDLACCFDFLGRETEAEPNYERVFNLDCEGLPESDQTGLYVGYGSTLRNNGKFHESKQVLLKGIENFPNYPALKVFLGFTLYSSGEFQEASRVLLKMSGALPFSVMEGYERAAHWYSEKLDD